MTTLDPYTSKGFFTFAQDNPYCNYMRLAYAQALSIKLTQKHSDYAIAINTKTAVPPKYKQVFDHIIVLHDDDAKNQTWKLGNEWKAGHLSPFDQTLKVDCDMLFFKDLADEWDIFDRYDLVATTDVRTYRGELVTSDYYRKTFTSNNLPNFYSGLFYYRKTEQNFELFKLVKWLMQNWEKHGHKFMDHTRPPRFLPTDEAFALAIKLMGIKLGHSVPTFVHMKKHIQDVDIHAITEQWHEHLDYYFDNKMNLVIENFKQTHPVHYHCKEFITDEIIAQYEKALGI